MSLVRTTMFGPRGTKEMMQPHLIYLHLISLVARFTLIHSSVFGFLRYSTPSKFPACKEGGVSAMLLQKVTPSKPRVVYASERVMAVEGR